MRPLSPKYGRRRLRTERGVMFDDARELVVGRMRDYCEHREIRINSSVPCSPSRESPNANITRDAARFKPPAALLGRDDVDLHVPAQYRDEAGCGAFTRLPSETEAG